MGALNGAHCAFESPAEEYISGVKQNPSIRSMLAHYCALKDSAQPVKDRLSVLRNDSGVIIRLSYQVRYTWSSCDSGWEQLCWVTTD